MTGPRWALVVATLMIGAGLGWWYWPAGQDPAVAKMLEAQAAIFAPPTPGENLEGRRDGWRKMREQMDALTPEQRQQVRDRGEEIMRDRMRAEMQSFFALPPSERVAAMDKRIDEMQKMWSQFNGGRGGRGGRGDGERRREGGQRGGPGANGQGGGGNNATAGGGGGGGGGGGRGGPGGGGFGRGDRGNTTSAERRRQYLDRSTPQDRAMRSEYTRLMRDRMKARGLQPPGRPRA